jgi:hypothetical protein
MRLTLNNFRARAFPSCTADYLTYLFWSRRKLTLPLPAGCEGRERYKHEIGPSSPGVRDIIFSMVMRLRLC